jgi:hypothetical protein
VQRESEKRSNPDIPTPGFITDRVDVTGVEPGGATGVEPSGATGVDPSEADPFASHPPPGCRATPIDTTSLWDSATQSYMDRQS